MKSFHEGIGGNLVTEDVFFALICIRHCKFAIAPLTGTLCAH